LDSTRDGGGGMTGPDFDHFCALVRSRSGFVITPDKGYLVRSRLDPVARSVGLASAAELLAHIKRDNPISLIERCVEAMAIHESFFFRDGAPFEQMSATLLPALLASRKASKTLRIWCAACSSGQEPYSVAMVLQEFSLQLSGWKLEIVATDLSEQILRKARSGLYSDFEVRRGLSPERLRRFFRQEGASWEISPTLRQMVTFKSHNLIHGAASMGRFDLIFCRNVLIYFDVEQKRRILNDLAQSLAEDGSLFLGSAETVIGLTDAFELTPGTRGLYRRSHRIAAARSA
jgi:chemotaxis protein methyltransferase CheR